MLPQISLTAGYKIIARTMHSETRSTWTFHSAGQIIFGPDATSQIGEVAAGLKAQRVLLVTDPLLARAGLGERLRSAIEARNINVTLFEGGEPEPSIRVALE